MANLYIATTQRSTSVTSSIVCSFCHDNDHNLIIARGNYLEIYSFDSNGLVLIKSFPLYGKITKIQKYRPSSLKKDLVFVLTAKHNFIIIGWDESKQQLNVHTTGSLNDNCGKEVEDGHILFIDPDNRMIGIIVKEGQMKALPIDNSSFKEAFDLRLEILKQIDVKFLYGCGRPTLCMLFEDDRNQRHMKTYTVEIKEKELLSSSWEEFNLDSGSSFIIPIPTPVGGIVIIGESTVRYMNNNKNTQIAAIQSTQITTWGMIDSNGYRYLLGDHSGNLYVLVLIVEGSQVVSIAVSHLGTTTIAESINYLDNGVVFIGSSLGDSQLIRLNKNQSNTKAMQDELIQMDVDLKNTESLNSSSSIEVLDIYPNIGPIVDMCVVTGDRQGQSQLVTCSGAYNHGTLRIIRSGIGINEQASMELQGLKGLWSIKLEDDNIYHKFLIQSYTGESRVLAMENGEMGEIENEGSFVCLQQTLFCCNIQGGYMVQVTSSTVRLLRIQNTSNSYFELAYEYVPSKSVILATGNHSQIVLALAGGEVVYLELDMNTTTLIERSSVVLDNDIACLSLQSNICKIDSIANSDDMVIDYDLNEVTVEKSQSANSSSSILAVGLWTENTIRLFLLPSLQQIDFLELSTNETQVRDVMIVQLGRYMYLLLGLGDGTLLTYTIDFKPSAVVINGKGACYLSNRRKVVIGTHPISLSGFFNGGIYCVFCSCDRPTIIYNNYDKLLFAVVNINNTTLTSNNSASINDSDMLDSEATGNVSSRGIIVSNEVLNMTSFNNDIFPDSLCLISEHGLIIGTIDSIQKIHIQTYPIVDSTTGIPSGSPRRIAYHISSGLYIVIVETSGVMEYGLETKYSITCYDESQDMTMCFKYELDSLEICTAVTTAWLSNGSNRGLDTSIESNYDSYRDYPTARASEEAQYKEYIVVGTSYYNPAEDEPSKGRLLIFEVTNVLPNAASSSSTSSTGISPANRSGKGIQLVASKLILAAVYTLAPGMRGTVVGGIGSKVIVFSLSIDENAPTQQSEIKQEAVHDGYIIALYVKTQGDFILVGDLMRSMTLLKFQAVLNAGSESSSSIDMPTKFELVEVARDFSANYMRSVEILGNTLEYFLGVDDSMNLFTVKRRLDSTLTPEEQGRLDLYGEYHLGDHINIIRQGSISAEDNLSLALTTKRGISEDIISDKSQEATGLINSVTGTPISSSSYLFGTITGAIGTILTLSDEKYRFFFSLELAVKSVIGSVGGLSHNEWRSFHNERRNTSHKHFIDGDLVETFLDISRENQIVITRQLNDDLNIRYSINSSSSSSANQSDTKREYSYSVEEVLRIVEDISRLH